MIFQNYYCYCQTFNGAINAETFLNTSNISNVENTGADMVQYDQSYSKVMVYDGDAPQFAWECDNGSGYDDFYNTGVVMISDPDVVLTNDLRYAIVCYELDGYIYMSVWQLNQGVYSEIIGSFGQYNFPYLIEEGTNPNIDIGFDDEYVITWELNMEIKALAGDYAGGVFSLSSNIANVAPEIAWTPDVTVCDDYVTFTYIRVYNDTDEWVTHETNYTDVYNDNVTGTIMSIKKADPSLNATFGRPRIASPPQYPSYPTSDYTTVVDYYWEDMGYGMWDILVFQYDNNSYSNAPIPYNPNFYTVPNYEPVVTYMGDLGVVCWTATIEYPNTSYTSLDVVALYFQTSGGLGLPYSWDGPVVNMDFTGTQNIPSVAGRRWNDGYGFYFWKDESNDYSDMVHRTSYEGTLNMRLMPDSSADHFVNKSIEEGFNIEIAGDLLTINSENPAFRYYIADMTGRILFNGEQSSYLTIHLSPLPIGIYLVACEDGINRKVRKFVRY
jgi:hypothetical protein